MCGCTVSLVSVFCHFKSFYESCSSLMSNCMHALLFVIMEIVGCHRPLFREQTLDLATGVSRLLVRELGTVYPPYCGSLTLNLDTLKILKAFLFGDTATHLVAFDINTPCINRFTYLLVSNYIGALHMCYRCGSLVADFFPAPPPCGCTMANGWQRSVTS